MIEQARKMFSEVLIDHWLNPRNVGRIDYPQGLGRASTDCGDSIEISFAVTGDTIFDVRCATEGCGTTAAVGSMLTVLIKGKTVRQALGIGTEALITSLSLPAQHAHCADLAVAALKKALSDYFILKREPWKRGYRR